MYCVLNLDILFILSSCAAAIQPAGLLIPTTIVVMISIIKDGIEDVKRHRADNRTNNRLARVVGKDVSDLGSCVLNCNILRFQFLNSLCKSHVHLFLIGKR